MIKHERYITLNIWRIFFIKNINKENNIFELIFIYFIYYNYNLIHKINNKHF